jgi:hypothetical protein
MGGITPEGIGFGLNPIKHYYHAIIGTASKLFAARLPMREAAAEAAFVSA